MAVLDSEGSRISRKKRKREPLNNHRKLLVDERVEVRSVEDGFKGSWHSGIVVACDKKRHRSIRYDHLLSDENSGELIETVRVSPVLDGAGEERLSLLHSRGIIRPLPPPAPARIWDLHYGLCVDAEYNDAWWEGVVLDHEDGSSKRRVFFPDLGDELTMEIGLLRITWDWDAATGEWERRGSWALLEVIEEFEQEHGHALPVSMKQIWYEVRERSDFQKVREWTCGAKELWKDMVMEVCGFYLELLAEELCRILKCPRSLVPNLMDSVASDVSGSARTGLDVYEAFVPVNEITNDWLRQSGVMSGVASLVNSDVSAVICLIASNTSQSIEAVGNLNQVSPSSQCNHDESPTEGIITKDCSEIIAGPGNSVSVNTGTYKPVSSDMLPAAEFCPGAVGEYLNLVKKKSRILKKRASLFKDVWKHILYLGWKIEHSKENGMARKRYTPPGGKCLYSLIEVCNHLTTSTADLISSPSGDEPRIIKDSPSAPRPFEQPQESRNPNTSPQATLFPASSPDPDYCSELYTGYCRNGGSVGPSNYSDLGPKAKEQLLTYGWVIRKCVTKNGKKYHVYIPPAGGPIYSLKSACKAWCEMKNTDISACKRTSRIKFILGSKGASIGNTETHSKALSEEASQGLWTLKVKGIRKARRKRDVYLYDFATHLFQSQINMHAEEDVTQNGSMKSGARSQPKCRNSTSSTAIKSKVSEDKTRPACVLRSSKCVRDVVMPSSSHRNPLSVLSWLIDNGSIVPRTKVRCISRKNKRKSAEGRISGRGIKCSCCMKMFTLSGFVVHAGKKYRRKAAANIFLDDGRSIFDCAKLSVSKRKSFATESHDKMKSDWRKGENDHICSVCQYGGELMLCDRCPAAFHKNCLGLKDIPEGDWFCRSCQCRKCGASNYEKDEEHTKDESILTCSQCELKYHIGCLNTKQLAKIKADPWFCGKTCKKIYYKLQKFIGKQTTLDSNNLTWSLLKTTKTNSHKTESEIDAVENHIKLDVALTVIHECFKPVREARTRRDLVEDVIFSRESELQRLNFRGFYTAILTRNDELISVATVRIHGKEVAEVPLVGTRFQYRRLGMCRILMEELEKKLTQLGVERLVLPAVPSVLSTWTGSFGFSEMTASERLHFLDYTFLDFQGTTMCQKLLKNDRLTELCPLNVMRPGLNGTVCDDGENPDIDRSSAVSEVYQAEQTEDDQFASQGKPEFSTAHKADTEISLADIALVVRKKQNCMIRPCFDYIKSNQDLCKNSVRRLNDGNLFSKFYIRKKHLV